MFDFQSWGWCRGVRLHLLTCLVLFFSFQSSYSLSSNCNFQHRILSRTMGRPDFNGGTGDSHRHTFLHGTISDGQCTEQALTGPTYTTSPYPTTRIVFPGGGIFFYYQAGLINFLRERYDLSTCSFAGASAGALTATLTAADVDFFEATDLALKMAADAGVWDRSGGLQGIWGPMIEEWLDALLPESIDTLQDRITLLVTPIPSFGKKKISRFQNKQDLIKCNMASVHLVSNTFFNGNSKE